MEHMRFDIISGSIRILVVLCLKLLRSMSQLYKPIIIQSLARNGILRKPFLSGGNQ
ncbi:hypothetical protein ZEAMMB73_Zm00001d024826 [Zea mays]|uniref:Uncharacterized protein n=1 Tax=Zea mays TaxID=4577 RepID=A0A1D6J263_MAIZE|nr:hypothetical protein ZEAMMB73_Zm00001d024826 [Zea mays]AQK42130.1 hypothetical protein ZEAMMB73_Zm00001d024826 [Zea mays]